MTPLQITVAVCGLLGTVVGATLAFEARYEKAEAAEAAHEQLAAENETDRLNTELALITIKLDAFVETAKVRPLTEGEQIQLRSLEKQRDVILERLATKG